MLFDIRTIVLNYLIISLIGTIVIFQLYWQSRKRISGVVFWFYSILFQTIGLLLLVLRDYIPDLYSVIISNTIMTFGILMGLIGLEKFFGFKNKHIYNYILIALLAGSLAYFTYLQQNLQMRILLFSLVTLFVFSQCSWFLLVKVKLKGKKPVIALGFVFIGFAVLDIVRISDILFGNNPDKSLFHPNSFNGYIMLLFQALTILLVFNIILFYNKWLIEDINLEKEKYLKTFYLSPYAIVLTKYPSGIIIEVNNGFIEKTGYTKDEIIGKKTTDLNIWPKNEIREDILDELKNKKSIHNRELHFYTKDCNLLLGLFSAELINIGNEYYILSTINDITEYHKIYTALKESEEQIRSFFENSMDAILLGNINGRILYSNTAASKLFGYSKTEFLDLTRNEIIDKSDSHIPKLVNENYINGKAKGEARFVKKDGTVFPCEISSAVYKNHTGEKFGSIIIRDISDRKQKEEAILHRDLLIREMGKVAKIGAWEFDPVTGNGSWTEEVALIHDLDPQDSTNLSIGLSFYSGDSKIKIENAIKLAIEKGIPYDLELELTTAKGVQKWVHIIGTPIIENNKTIKIRGSFQDISYKKSIEKELQNLNDELEKRIELRTNQLNNINKELEAFIYSVSHDLRAPLRAIDGFSKIFAEDYQNLLDNEGKQICKLVNENTQHMSNLIDGLLAFSRLNKSEFNYSHVNLNVLINSIYTELVPDWRKNKIDFQVEELPEIISDLSHIKQIWTNLISNAIKFTSNNAEAIIKIGFEEGNHEYTFYIEDNGVGFNTEYKDKLFNVFQRLHSVKEFEGSGIGLAIVKRIVSRHGGNVWAKGDTNKGATFYFTLPILNEKIEVH